MIIPKMQNADVIKMDVSVIIPTRNPGLFLKRILDQLRIQTIRPKEIFIIDSGSTDDSIIMVNDYYPEVDIVTIDPANFNHGGTRNLAADRTHCDVIVFLTQDSIPYNEYCIENLLKPFSNDKIVAVYGRQIAKDNSNPIERFARLFNYPEQSRIKSKSDIATLGIKTFFFSNVCSAFRRKIFYQVGCFSNKVIMNEDMIIASRLILDGYLVAYESTAEVIHSHDFNIIKQFKRYFDIGVSMQDNKDIFGKMNTNSEGLKFVKECTRYLLDNGHFLWIFALLIESGIKLLGYKMGYNYKKIPLKLRKAISLHNFYWNNL